MSTRVVFDGVPNEPIPFEDARDYLAPILEALGGLDPADVLSVTITGRRVSAKVVVRTRRGRRTESWAHVSRVVDYPVEEV